MEIHYGEFSLEVEFPGSVDVDHVEADYDDGFLRISLPKIGPKQINLEGR
jgi:HSP20 family molecular chaperone IbpA